MGNGTSDLTADQESSANRQTNRQTAANSEPHIFEGQGRTIRGTSSEPVASIEEIREAFLTRVSQTDNAPATTSFLTIAARAKKDLRPTTPEYPEKENPETENTEKEILETSTGGGVGGSAVESAAGSETVAGRSPVDSVSSLLLNTGRMEDTGDSALPSTAAENLSEKNAATKTSKQKKENCIMEALWGCSLIPSANLSNVMAISNPALYRSGVALFLPDLLPDILQEDPYVTLQQQPLLGLHHAERVVIHGVAFFLHQGSPLALRWLSDCYSRCSDSFIASQMTTLRAWRGLSSPEGEDAVALTDWRQLIVWHAVLCLQCSEYFKMAASCEPLMDPPAAATMVVEFLTVAGASCQQFLHRTLEEVSNNDSEDFSRLLCAVFDLINQRLESRQINNRLDSLMSGVQCLLSLKSTGAVLRSRPCFRLTNNNAATPRGNGWILQGSFLGHVVRPSPLDDIYFLNDQAQSTRVRCFSQIFGKTSAIVNQTLLSLRNDMACVIDTSAACITSLCRGDSKARTESLEWIGLILTANEKRHQQILQHQLEYLSNVSPAMEAVSLRSHGMSSSGFNINLFWILLKLLEPVKVSKVVDLDPFYILREEASPLLGEFGKEACFGDVDEIEKARSYARTCPEWNSASKFPTQLIWLAFKGLRCLFVPFVKSYGSLLRRLEDLQSQIQENPGTHQQQYETLISQLLCFNVVIQHPLFLNSWWSFCHLSLTYFSRMLLVFNEVGERDSVCDQSIADRGFKLTSLLAKRERSSSSPPPQFLCLPTCVIEDLLESISFFLSIRSDLNRRDTIISSVGDSIEGLDVELLSSFCIFIMNNDTLIKSPHIRWSCGAQPLFVLSMHPKCASRMEAAEAVGTSLVPCVIRAFIDAQKASYYERIQQRLIYTRLLEKALGSSQHSHNFQLMTKSDPELFVRFLAMLVESMTWLLEEGMSSLAEIKKRETAGTATSTAEQQQQQQEGAPSGTDEEMPFDPQTTEGGQSVTEIPFEQLEKLCQSVMDGGLRAIKVMTLVVKICGVIIVESPLLLPQVVTSLDCCLDHLVGPRCLQLKVSNFEKYSFDPRVLLASTCAIYLSLETADGSNGRLVSAICNDTRYFKPAVFLRALKIVRREGLLASKELAAFSELTRLLQDRAELCEEHEQWLTEIWEDVPDEYKDPIMDELISDPVRLPTSGHVMDRKHIERHLMTEEFDPFNRMPLEKKDLVPLPDLKLEIDSFIASKRAEKLNSDKLKSSEC